MALSISSLSFKRQQQRRMALKKRFVILTATSGDTGKAALEGFADVEGTKIICFLS